MDGLGTIGEYGAHDGIWILGDSTPRGAKVEQAIKSIREEAILTRSKYASERMCQRGLRIKTTHDLSTSSWGISPDLHCAVSARGDHFVLLGRVMFRPCNKLFMSFGWGAGQHDVALVSYKA